MLKLGRVTNKSKGVLSSAGIRSNIDLYEFSAAILEKGLLTWLFSSSLLTFFYKKN